MSYIVVSLEPVTSQQSEITSRRRERHRNHRTAQDLDASKTSGGLVECQRGKVEIASYLILHLQNISKICPWWDWTICAIDSILP